MLLLISVIVQKYFGSPGWVFYIFTRSFILFLKSSCEELHREFHGYYDRAIFKTVILPVHEHGGRGFLYSGVFFNYCFQCTKVLIIQIFQIVGYIYSKNVLFLCYVISFSECFSSV